MRATSNICVRVRSQPPRRHHAATARSRADPAARRLL